MCVFRIVRAVKKGVPVRFYFLGAVWALRCNRGTVSVYVLTFVAFLPRWQPVKNEFSAKYCEVVGECGTPSDSDSVLRVSYHCPFHFKCAKLCAAAFV